MNPSGLKNKFVKSILSEFTDNFGISTLEEYKRFEYLANYLVISKLHPEAFESSADLISVDADTGSGYGIDAVGVIINGNLVTNVNDVSTYAKSRSLDVTIVFIQSKTANKYESGSILKFVSAVNNFFSGDSNIEMTGELGQAKEIVDEVLSDKNIRLINRKAYPKLKLYYVTSAKEATDKMTLDIVKQQVDILKITNQDFPEITLELLGADYLVDTYDDISNQYTVKLFFDKKLEMNTIEKVEGSYIGYLDFENFMTLITDSSGVIRKNIFYENVRDFQGRDNKVNNEISETLSSDDLRDKFILLNNGITVVAKRLMPLQNNFYELGDFQIVNGCQTSNMIYLHREILKEDNSLRIPIKLIYTIDNDITNRIVRATNRQTPVPDEAFIALEKFHQDLQKYYELESKSLPNKLYYERRSKEYQNDERGIQKYRIVNIYKQIRAFTAVILNEPHTVASNNPNSILSSKEHILFQPDHKKELYFISAYILFHINSDIARGVIVGKDNITYQFYIAMLARIIITNRIKITQFNGKQAESDFSMIVSLLNDEAKRTELYKTIFKVLNYSKKKFKEETKMKSPLNIIRTKVFKDLVIRNVSSEIQR